MNGLNGFEILTRATKERVMPFKEPDPTDPNMLVGVVLPADAEAMRDMAYVFAEEFTRLGYSRGQLLWLFKNPFYGGAHGAYRALGEQETLNIIDECLGAWGHVQIRIQDVQNVQSLCSVQAVQTPPTSSLGTAGEEESPRLEPLGPAERERLNGLNDWNELNPTEEEKDDAESK